MNEFQIYNKINICANRLRIKMFNFVSSNKDNMIRKIFQILTFFFLFGFGEQVIAQEINATVTIEHRQIQGTNVAVFETLKGALTEFINNRKWTDQEYESNERIECNFLLNLESNEGSSYKGSLSVTARRPIYNAAINTTLLNLYDKKFSFTYNEFDPLVLNINSLTQDLTAVVGYYVYMILGLDADSFSPYGGDEYYNTSIAIVNSAQSSNVLSVAGWDRLDKDGNRHSLGSQMISSEFRPLREYMYLYHIKGLDVMANNVDQGAQVIIDGLDMLEKVHSNSPASYAMLLFFDVKYLEISNVIKNMDLPEVRKKELVSLLKKIDPSRLKNYDSL